MSGYRLRNFLQSIVLLGGLALLLVLLGWSFAGSYGVVWAFFIGILPFLLTVRLFPLLTLKMYGARLLANHEAPELHRIVTEICDRASLTASPTLCYIPSNSVLIFSVGGGANATIAISGGIFHLFTLRELVAVLGHEVAHIRHGDTWVMAFADVVTRISHFLSFFGMILVLVNLPFLLVGEATLPWLPIFLMVTAPTVSALLQLALSRNREFEADLAGAELTGDPEGLATALDKLEAYRLEVAKRSVIPVRGEEPSFLRTHPATQMRIERLRRIAKGDRAYDEEGEQIHEHLGKSPMPKKRRWWRFW